MALERLTKCMYVPYEEKGRPYCFDVLEFYKLKKGKMRLEKHMDPMIKRWRRKEQIMDYVSL